MDSLTPGTLLARRYRLTDRIGVGGMSVIWRAHDEMLDRCVAVKVLAADLAADPRFRDLVRAEARAAAALVHPHITATYDYGETFHTDDGVTAYVVMELLDGEPLSARLTAGPLTWPEALRICAEVAEALAAAHRHGIVHRDVTADNVMLTSGGSKILDFGIATTVGAPDEDSDGMTFGTPAYVAPERLDGRRARPATDTYALGVLLFETLTGQPPYPAETWEELAATDRDEPPPLVVDGLPAPVTDLYRRCLATDPTKRPTASQVARALRRHLPVTGHRERVRRGGPRLLAAVGAAAALLLGVMVGGTVLPGGPRFWPDEASLPESGPTRDRAAEHPLETPTPGPGSVPPPPMPTVPSSGNLPGGAPGDAAQGGSPAGTSPGPIRPTTPGQLGGTHEVSLLTLAEVVEDGHARAHIREDVALDLRQLIANLEREVTAGTTDLASATQLLRHRVTTRLAEGALSRESAEELTDVLDQLTSV